MYGIFTYMKTIKIKQHVGQYTIDNQHVGKYTSPMDGFWVSSVPHVFLAVLGFHVTPFISGAQERSSGSSSTVRLSPEDALFQDDRPLGNDKIHPKSNRGSLMVIEFSIFCGNQTIQVYIVFLRVPFPM